MKTLEEIRSLPTKDLVKELERARHNLYKMELDISTNQSKAVHTLRRLKKYIAQLRTVQSRLPSKA